MNNKYRHHPCLQWCFSGMPLISVRICGVEMSSKPSKWLLDLTGGRHVLVLLARKFTARCCCSIALLSAIRSHHRLRMRILWILKIRRIHHFLWIYEANVLTQLVIKGNSVVMSAKRQHWPANRPTLCHKMSILVSCAKGTFMASYFMTYFYVLQWNNS